MNLSPPRLLAALWILILLLLLCSGWPIRVWEAWRAYHPTLEPAKAGFIALETAKLLLCALGMAAWFAVLRLKSAFDSRFLLACSMAAGPLLALPLIWLNFSAVIGGERVWWLEDDAMVSMRYARNLAAGLGLVWNQGERVEGYSDFLWLLGMAKIHWLGAGARAASLWVHLANLALLSLGALATFRLARALGALPLPAAVAALAVSLSYGMVKCATSGLETLAVAWAFSECLVLLLNSPEGDLKLPWAPFAAAGLLGLLRADAPVLSLGVLGWAVLTRREMSGWTRALVLALGPALAYEAFRLAYFSDWLPNTARLKSGAWPGRAAHGALYAWGFFALQYPGAALLAGLGIFKAPLGGWGRKPAAFLTLALAAAYAAWTGGDQYDFKRFLIPVLPLLMALAAAALTERSWLAGSLLILLSSQSAVAHYPWLAAGLGGRGKERVELALKLKEIAEPGQKLAAMLAGSVFYFSGLGGVDLLGRCDSRVARLEPHPGMTLPGHNKFDLEGSFSRGRPDFIYAEYPLGGQSPFYERLLSFNPWFKRHCARRPVISGSHGAIYGCAWPAPLPAR